MGGSTGLGHELFVWVLIPALIFVARICDCSIGTMRIIFIQRGNRLIAPILGFFEVLIWLLAIRQIMMNLTNSFYYVAYGGGFATGTFVGMYIEERLAMGTMLIRIVTSQEASGLIDYLKSEDYGVTSVDAQGARGDVNLIYTIIKRSDLDHVVEIINRFNPRAFYTIEDVRFAREGVFPESTPSRMKSYMSMLRFWRKGK
ncbi:MAG: DUF2179 domain-containing protein [Candidatus Krumholzibacteria bacterium]|nr:DUF2179 domain-containing protein [Candidatus Krumholzibacteria bacterium]